MKRYGLVLSGGAAKGAFLVGALQWIRQEKGIIDFKVVSGTSTGSLVGTMVALRDWANLERIYRSVETPMLVNPYYPFWHALKGPEAVFLASAVFGGDAIYSTEGLERIIDTYIPDFQIVIDTKNDTELIYNTVDMQTGQSTYFSNRSYPAAKMRKALIASANQPVLTPLIDIRVKTRAGTAAHQFTDGGVKDHTPLKAVFDSSEKLDAIIAMTTAPLSHDAEDGQHVKYKSISDILLRVMGIFGRDVFENDIRTANLYNALLHIREAVIEEGGKSYWNKLLRGLPKEVRDLVSNKELDKKNAVDIHYVYPEKEIEIDNLRFSKEEMEKAFREGRKRAKALLANTDL